MSKKFVALQLRAQQTLGQIRDHRDAGQGALEYVGMIIIASLIIVAVAAALNPSGIGTALSNAVSKFLNPSSGG